VTGGPTEHWEGSGISRREERERLVGVKAKGRKRRGEREGR